MNRTLAVLAAFLLLWLAAAAQGNVFDLGGDLTNLRLVPVGDAGNAGELSGLGAGGWGPDRVCGAVDYRYKIGTYEVTAAQYVDFLSCKAKTDDYGLYSTNMWSKAAGCKILRSGVSGSYTYSVASDWANRPVNYVSYWDACRFVNWLCNGQGDGSTETGAYTLNGYNGAEGSGIGRNPGAKWFLPTEDEWYKAAFYNRSTGGYWIYATASDVQPSAILGVPADLGNTVTYDDVTVGSPYLRTVVGEHENTPGPYGTFDMNGNVWEWNETLVDPVYPTYRGVRGGNWGADESDLRGSARGNYNYPSFENSGTGFRVAGAIVSPLCGMSNRAAGDPVANLAQGLCSFKVWGKVSILTSDSFMLDDGSGSPVKVVAVGYHGIANNDYASASGTLSGTGANRVLSALESDVLKLR